MEIVRRPVKPEKARLDPELCIIGQASKRGLIPRQPSVDALVADAETWLRTKAAEELRSVRRAATNGPGTALEVDFHPAAELVRISFLAGGRVQVVASTTEVGPGYHTWLCHLLRRFGVDLSIDWTKPSGDDGGYFWSDSRADVERSHLLALRQALREAGDGRAHEAGVRSEPVHLGTFGGHRFDADAPLVSPLGPRSTSWLAQAVDSPAVATDVWPWVADALDARYLLNRVLSVMWTELRWRAPATDDERDLLDDVLRRLRRAFQLDPSLPYPWREWRECLQLCGLATDPMTERVVRESRAADAFADAPVPPIGYRRGPVTVLHEGWRLVVPGSWAERRTDEEWSGGEGGRSVTLAATETGEDGRPMSAEAFLDKVAGNLGPSAITHSDGPLVGRARLVVGTDSGMETATLEGFSAVRGSGAAIRIEIHDPGDWEWALELWRSLVPSA